MEKETIGIIVGVCVLYLIVMIFVVRSWFCPKACRCWFRDPDSETIVRMELSPEAYNDFINGRMTSKLRSEIIHLYTLKGDLYAYIHIASRRNYAYMTEFLKDPTRHPLVLSNLVRKHSTVMSTAKAVSEDACGITV